MKLKTATSKTITNIFEKYPSAVPLAYFFFFELIGRWQNNDSGAYCHLLYWSV